jgi:hypothetical protein
VAPAPAASPPAVAAAPAVDPALVRRLHRVAEAIEAIAATLEAP